MTIEYRYEDGTLAAQQTDLENSTWADRLVLLAQKSMSGTAYATAHIFRGDGFETVVSKATEWQKRNG
jgi:hypothetical protein